MLNRGASYINFSDLRSSLYHMNQNISISSQVLIELNMISYSRRKDIIQSAISKAGTMIYDRDYGNEV